MPRGGERQGTPGTSYSNRTDLNANRQPVTAPTGLPYGQRQQLEQAQQAVPLPNVASDHVVPLSDPTARPEEPITAGLPFGPGPGPSAIAPQGDSDTILQLRALYQNFPDENIARLIDLWEAGY